MKQKQISNSASTRQKKLVTLRSKRPFSSTCCETLISTLLGRKRKDGKRQGTYKSKNANWLGLLPNS